MPIGEWHPRAIPTRVVWLGLIANVTLYTLVIYPLLLIGLRRPFIEWRRKIQGRCLPCGYPLDDLAVCPSVARRRASASGSLRTARRRTTVPAYAAGKGGVRCADP